MDKTKKYIYTLSHPFSIDVRYVGCTSNPERRLINHIQLVDYGSTDCKKWVKSLLMEGLEPLLTILECCGDNWQDREVYWISSFIKKGSNLCNQTIGGTCGRLSQEHVLKKETQLLYVLDLIDNGTPVLEAERKAGLPNGYLYKVRSGKISYLKHIAVPYFRNLKRLKNLD